MGTITIAAKDSDTSDLARVQAEIGFADVERRDGALELRSEIAYPLLRTRVINVLEQVGGEAWPLVYELR